MPLTPWRETYPGAPLRSNSAGSVASRTAPEAGTAAGTVTEVQPSQTATSTPASTLASPPARRECRRCEPPRPRVEYGAGGCTRPLQPRAQALQQHSWACPSPPRSAIPDAAPHAERSTAHVLLAFHLPRAARGQHELSRIV
eukprot:365131-Chlamydomonas_euryale.AAC.3